MSYRLRVNNQFLDLFPDQDINIGVDYYDTTNIDSIKVPFTFNTSVPYTDKNKDILNYNHETSIGLIPMVDYDYSVYKGDDIISSGKARLKSVVINSIEPVFTIEMRDKVSEFSKVIRELEVSDIYNDSFSTDIRTLSTYLSSNQGYNQRPIEIPFIDFDNIQKTTGYETRQFTSWGTNGSKFGLMPALRITDFIDRVFSASGIEYTSKFISGTGSWDPRNLYMLYPTYLSASPESKRESFLFPFPYNVQLNSDQTSYVGDVTISGFVHEILPISAYRLIAKDSFEPFGPTNYAPEEDLISREYGDQFRTSSGVSDWGDENVGYVSYGSGFDAKFAFNSGSVNVSGLRSCFLSIDDEIDGGIYPHGVSITDASNCVFSAYFLIYESYTTSQAPLYRIPLVDSSGNKIELNPLSLERNSGMDDLGNGSLQPFGTVLFSDFTAYLDDSIPYKLNGGSTYSCAIGVYIESGYLECNTFAYARIEGAGPIVNVNVKTGVQLKQNDFVKQRTYGYDWSTLGVKVDNIGSVPATCPSDNFQFKESLSNNKSQKVYDLMVDILKRFGLSLVYDYATGKILLDNLKDIRLTMSSIDGYIDSLKPYEVESGTLPPKRLRLLNKENEGIYDKNEAGIAFGSFDGIWNQDGVGEQEIQFQSALINAIDKSVCGPEFFTDPVLLNNGLVSVNEIGDIKYEIPDYDKVGLRIFYLRQPDYATTLRYPVFRQYNDYGQKIRQIVYKPVGTYVFQGYPVNSLSGNQKDLRFVLADGSTTEAYEYLVSTERFIASEKSKMSFYAAIPDTMFQNGDLYRKRFVFGKTNEKFIVNSLSDGKIYNGYVYGKFEVIFVD